MSTVSLKHQTQQTNQIYLLSEHSIRCYFNEMERLSCKSIQCKGNINYESCTMYSDPNCP